MCADPLIYARALPRMDITSSSLADRIEKVAHAIARRAAAPIDGGIDGERLRTRRSELAKERGEDGLLGINAIVEPIGRFAASHGRRGRRRPTSGRSRKASDELVRPSRSGRSEVGVRCQSSLAARQVGFRCSLIHETNFPVIFSYPWL
jgi:hypothetical protein